ncbi:hypothetical protein PCE1_000353 [Barthelona sp. PCE]
MKKSDLSDTDILMEVLQRARAKSACQSIVISQIVPVKIIYSLCKHLGYGEHEHLGTLLRQMLYMRINNEFQFFTHFLTNVQSSAYHSENFFLYSKTLLSILKESRDEGWFLINEFFANDNGCHSLDFFAHTMEACSSFYKQFTAFMSSNSFDPMTIESEFYNFVLYFMLGCLHIFSENSMIFRVWMDNEQYEFWMRYQYGYESSEDWEFIYDLTDCDIFNRMDEILSVLKVFETYNIDIDSVTEQKYSKELKLLGLYMKDKDIIRGEQSEFVNFFAKKL